jgi:hypothetical protein
MPESINVAICFRVSAVIKIDEQMLSAFADEWCYDLSSVADRKRAINHWLSDSAKPIVLQEGKGAVSFPARTSANRIKYEIPEDWIIDTEET